jgi:hypothetical protein
MLVPKLEGFKRYSAAMHAALVGASPRFQGFVVGFSFITEASLYGSMVSACISMSSSVLLAAPCEGEVTVGGVFER